jgi:RimJ/RimL family protein N-acetyltransferase
VSTWRSGASGVALVSDGVVSLRRPEPSDAPYFLQMRNNLALVSAVMGYRLGVTEDNVKDWLAHGGVTGDDVLFTAVAAGSGEPLGYVKAFRFDRFSRTTWVGLSLFDERNFGKGIGGRMLTLFSDYLRTQLAVRKISLEVLAGNAPALALYAKHGFAEEGRLTAHYYADGRYHDVLILSRFFETT